MYIENHLLKGTFAGRSAKQLHCNKKSGLLEYPDMIVLHYTAGGNAMSSAHYLARPIRMPLHIWSLPATAVLSNCCLSTR